MLRKRSAISAFPRSRATSAEHCPTTSTAASWGRCQWEVGRKTLVPWASTPNARSSSRIARRTGPTWTSTSSSHPMERSSQPRSPSRPILSPDATASSSTPRSRPPGRPSERWTTRKSRGGMEHPRQAAAPMAVTARAQRPSRSKSPTLSRRGNG